RQRLLIGVERCELHTTNAGSDESVYRIRAGPADPQHHYARGAFDLMIKHGISPRSGRLAVHSWKEIANPGPQCGAYPFQAARTRPIVAWAELFSSPGQKPHTGREGGTAHSVCQ